MPRISAKIACDRRERVFVHTLVSSMGKKGKPDITASYRTAFGASRDDGVMVFPDLDPDDMTAEHRRKALEDCRELSPAQVATKATGVYRRVAVQRYFKELTVESTVSYAQMVLEEQVVTGDAKEAMNASKRILEDKDKVQRRELVSEFWAITKEIGGEIDVPLPGEVRKTVICPCGCNHEMEVITPISARFPGGASVPGRGEAKGTIRVGVKDLEQRRAYLHLGDEARIALAKMAGAPWSEVDPDAQLSPLQIEALKEGARTQILHGGSGVGKSVTGGLKAALDTWIPYNIVAVMGQSYENVAPEFEYVDRFYRRIFGGNTSMFVRIANINRSNYHDFEVAPIWGSNCRGYSLDHNEGAVALGKSMDTVVIGEGAFVSTQTLNTKIRRALDRSLMLRPGYPEPRETGKLIIFTTPNDIDGCAADIVSAAKRTTQGDFSKLAYGRVSYAESLWFREAEVTENPSYDRRIFEARRKEMIAQNREHEFDMVYRGKMTSKSGRVYSHFFENRHVIPMPSRDDLRQMRFALGVDTGAFYASMLVGIDRQKRMYWLGEVKTEKQTIETSCRETSDMILERMPYDYQSVEQALDRIDLHVPDPASQFKMDLMDHLPGFSISSPSRQQGNFELLPTISMVNELFASDRLFIVDDLVLTLDEIDRYLWKSGKSQVRRGMFFVKEPARENDHLLDAGRYSTIPLMELGPLDEEPTQLGLVASWEQAQRERIHGPLRKILADAEASGGIYTGGMSL